MVDFLFSIESQRTKYDKNITSEEFGLFDAALRVLWLFLHRFVNHRGGSAFC